MAQTVRTLALALSCLSAVVGAGFASGREAYQFFARHGTVGILGVALAASLFYLGTVLIFALAARHQAEDLRTFLRQVLPRAAGIVDGALHLFTFLTLAIVLAGGLEVLSPLLGPFAAFVLPFGVSLLLGRGLRTMQLAQGFLVGVLVVAVALVFVQHGADPGPFVATGRGLWWLAAAEYAAYNLALSLPFLLLVARNDAGGHRRWALVLASGTLLALLLAIVAVSLPHISSWREEALPMLRASAAGGPALRLLYSLALTAATMAAALSYLAALTKRLSGLLGERWWLPYALSLAPLPLASLGVVRLVATVYPIMGLGSMVLFAFLAWRWLTPKCEAGP